MVAAGPNFQFIINFHGWSSASNLHLMQRQVGGARDMMKIASLVLLVGKRDSTNYTLGLRANGHEQFDIGARSQGT